MKIACEHGANVGLTTRKLIWVTKTERRGRMRKPSQESYALVPTRATEADIAPSQGQWLATQLTLRHVRRETEQMHVIAENAAARVRALRTGADLAIAMQTLPGEVEASIWERHAQQQLRVFH